MTQVLHCLNSFSSIRVSMINDKIERVEEKEEVVGFVPDSDEENQEGMSTRSIKRFCSVTRKAMNAEQESSYDNGDSIHNQEKATESEVSLRCSQNSYSDKCLSRINSSTIRKLFNEEPLCKIDKYIGSEEPGNLSQDIAMKVVDKLLCDNEVGSYQDIDPGKTVGLNSPPIFNVKGVKCLAKWTNHRNSVRELTTFDWHENERTEFTNESRVGTKKSHSQMLKPTNADTIMRQISEYASNIRDSSSTEKLHISETEFNQLLEDGDAQLNTEDDVGVVEEMYGIGLNTQMAAQVMEALCHGSPLNHGLCEATHSETVNLIEDLNMGVPLDRAPTDYVSHPKRVSPTCDLKGNLICYKRRKLQCTKLIKGSPYCSRKYSNSTKKKRGKWEIEAFINVSDASNSKKLIGSPNQNKECSSVDSFIKEVEMSGISRTSNIQISTVKRNVRGDLAFHAIPVAPRTRRSKPMKMSNWSKKFLDSVNALFVPIVESNSNEDPNQVTKFDKHVGNQQKKQFRPKTTRIIHQNASRKSTIGPKTRTSSQSVSVHQAKIRQPHTRRGYNKVVPKSLHEILDTVKQKKRSVSTRKVSSIYDARIKPSLKSPSFKPFSEKDSKEFKPDISEVTLMLSTHNSSVANGSLPTIEVSSMETAVSRAQFTPKISCSKHIRKLSIARELIRLEATEPSRGWLLQDSRRRKDMSKVRVLFSKHLDEDVIKQQSKILARFGVSIASSVRDATHFVADRFARTKNMLEAMALGKPVVTHMWLNSCAQASYFIDENNYILRDVKKEKEIGFSMPVSLARSRQQKLLQGRRVFITPNVKPGIEVVRSLVMAAHGQIRRLDTISKPRHRNNKIAEDLLVVSCEEDYAFCTSLLDKGVEVFDSDLLLNGIIIQKLEFDRYRLFGNHVKKTCSQYG